MREPGARGGLFLGARAATWTIGWHHGSARTLPVSVGLGYVLLREGQHPPLNFFITGEWMTYRHDAPIAPQTTVRLGLTIAFPQFSPW